MEVHLHKTAHAGYLKIEAPFFRVILSCVRIFLALPLEFQLFFLSSMDLRSTFTSDESDPYDLDTGFSFHLIICATF